MIPLLGAAQQRAVTRLIPHCRPASNHSKELASAVRGNLSSHQKEYLVRKHAAGSSNRLLANICKLRTVRQNSVLELCLGTGEAIVLIKTNDFARWPRAPLISSLVKSIAWRMLLQPDSVTEGEAQTLAASVAHHIQERENAGEGLYEELETAGKLEAVEAGRHHLKN